MELDRFEWLAKRQEAAVDPNRPIIDAHHHLWRNAGSTYGAAELLSDTGATHNVTHTVFVDCRSKWDRDAPPHMAPVGETRFVAAEAAAMDGGDGARIGAIVSHADMSLGAAVAEVLAAHDAAGAGLFRGIRHSVAWDADRSVGNSHTGSTAAMMRTPEFHAGVATLGAMGFSYDAWQYHTQLPELVELALAVPQTTIVLDHLGGPLAIGPYAADPQRTQTQWRAAMTEVAACPNVVLKVGGIGMDNFYATGWAALDAPPSSEQVAARWSDAVHFCIDLFGPSRCMFESNFPVDRQSLPYAVLWNALQIMAAGYSDAEQDELCSGTAARAYRIDRAGAAT